MSLLLMMAIPLLLLLLLAASVGETCIYLLPLMTIRCYLENNGPEAMDPELLMTDIPEKTIFLSSLSYENNLKKVSGVLTFALGEEET